MSGGSRPSDLSVHAFDRVTRWLYGAGLVLALLIAWTTIDRSGSQYTTLFSVAMLGVGSVGYCMVRGFTPYGACVVSVAVLIIHIAAPPGDQVVSITVALFSSYIALSGEALRSAAAVLAFNLVVVAVPYLKGDERDVAIVLVDSLARLATVLAVVICVRGGRRAAVELDRQTVRSAAQRRLESHALAQEAQTRWVNHFLHDGVVHALRAVTLGQRLSRWEVQSSAALVVADLARLGGSHAVAVNLRAELERAARDIELEVRWNVEEISAPVAVREALCQAIREALRNVRLHSGCGSAEVTVRRVGRGLRASVRDGGVGFDATRLPEDHFGVRNGIVGRFNDVGGTARVRSGARGTTVSFEWSPARSLGDWRGAFEVRSLAGDVGIPYVLLNIVQMALIAHTLAAPAFAVLATVLTSIVWFRAWRTLRRRDATGPEAAALMAIGLSASLAGGLSVPGTFEPTTYWLAGGTLVLFIFAIVARPVVETIPWVFLLLVGPTMLLAWRGADLAQLRQMAPALGMPATGVAMGYLVRFLLDRLGTHTEERMQAERESYERVAASAAREQLLAERVTDLNERIAPFLAEIALGRLDCRDPEVQRVAGVYEARVRDVLGGRITTWPVELVGIVDDLRVRGASLSLARHAEGLECQAALVRSVLSSLEPMDVSEVQVRVSWTPRPTGSLVSVTVTPYVARVERRLIGRLPSGSKIQTDHRSYLRFSHEGLAPIVNAGPVKPGHAPQREIETIER